MNITRVRYKEGSTGLMVSQELLANVRLVVASYNPTTFEYFITDRKTGEVLTNSQGSNLHNTKKRIKLSLKTLGVNFSDEIRRKN